MNYETIFKKEEKTLEQQRQEKLKEYGFDEESLKDFRSKIKESTEEESNTLGKILYEYLFHNGLTYNEVLNLITLGANVNYTDQRDTFKGCTPLAIAIHKKRYDIAKLLIKAGADINYIMPSRISSVMSCIEDDNMELFKILVLLNADLSIINEKHFNALDIAREKNNKECIQILESAMKGNSPDKQYKNIIKLDILECEQLYTQENFKVMKKHGTWKSIETFGVQAAITDFAIALGGWVELLEGIDKQGDPCDKIFLSKRRGHYWSKTPSDKGVYKIIYNGTKFYDNAINYSEGIRPYMLYSTISKMPLNTIELENGWLEIEFGEYPQWACSRELQKVLTQLYSNNSLNKMEKYYTTDSRDRYDYDKKFTARKFFEYEYENERYVLVKFKSTYPCAAVLSNGEKYNNGDFVWIKVSPLKWLVNIEKDIAISKNIIIAGIQFNNENNYTGNNFDEMNIKVFLDNYLSKEILTSEINQKVKNILVEESKPRTLFDTLKMAEEEMNKILEDIPFQKIKNR